MKIKISRALWLLTLLAGASAQAGGAGAGTYYTAGTNYLAQSNLDQANIEFSNAVSLASTDATYNLFYAVTRLAVLSDEPAGSNFLYQIGFETLPGVNDVFINWNKNGPTNAEGHVAIPPALNATNFGDQLRNNVLPTLTNAQNNLAAITATNFTVDLTTNETHLGAATVDWGDVQMVQAICYTEQLVIYTMYSWNWDFQLTTATNFFPKGDGNFAGFLTNYPSAFSNVTSADLPAAKIAFTNAINSYFAASEFIRNRAPGGTYLFNLDTNDMQRELNFRTTLSNLLSSLTAPTQLTEATNYTVSMGTYFATTFSPRTYFPQYQNDGFIWNTFPNVTFGSVITGLTETSVGKGYGKSHLFGRTGAILDVPGISLSVLYDFTNYSGQTGVVEGPDGSLYGTMTFGGPYIDMDPVGLGFGCVFKITTNGQFSILYNFGSDYVDGNPQDGAYPNALIVGSDGNLWGTTQFGGANQSGSIFVMSTTGAFTNWYNFGDHDDGIGPMAALVEGSDGRYYGTTAYGGYGQGTAFVVDTNHVFNQLYSFGDSENGAYPNSPMIQGSDGNLYGTTEYGGNGYGVIFQLIPQINRAQDIYTFGTVEDGNGDPLDGALPNGVVQGADGNLYGTTLYGGANDDNIGQNGFPNSNNNNDNNNNGIGYGDGDGTLFRISPTNSGSFTTLLSFDENFADGYFPIGSLVPGTGGTFYGVASAGGANSHYPGAVFLYNPTNTTTNIVWLNEASGCFNNNLSSSENNENSVANFYSEGGATFSYTPVLNPLIQGLHGNIYGTTTDNGIGLGDSNHHGTVYQLMAPAAAPTAEFAANPTSGSPPFMVSFTSPSMDSEGNQITNWSWAFGDGGTTNSQNPNYTYTNIGNFSPTLTVINTNGTVIIATGPSIDSFLAGQFGAIPTNGPAPLTVQFYSSSNDIYDNDIVSWDWEFGDGGSASAQNPSHTFESPGIYKPSLQTLDDFNDTAQLSGPAITVTGGNLPPSLTSFTWYSPLGLGATAYFALDDIQGTPPFSQQWSFEGTNIPGATNSSLTLTNVQFTNAGSYYVTISNPYGTNNTGPILLAITSTNQFTAMPTSGAGPLPVQFYAPTNDGYGNALTNWSWNFNDRSYGGSSPLPNPTYTYSNIGTFYPSLIANNANGAPIEIYGPPITVTSLAQLGATNLVEGPACGRDSVVLSDPNNGWSATANAPWLRLCTSNGLGGTNLIFKFDANPGGTRTGTITIANQTLRISQAGSTYVQIPTQFTKLVCRCLDGPSGVAVDGSGNIYFSDTFNNEIKEWLAANNTVTTIVSSNQGLSNPEGVALDAAGNVYIADTGNNAIDELTASNSSLITLASGDQVNTPEGVAVDAAGNVYIANSGNNTIMEWQASNSNVITLVSGDFSGLWGVAVDVAGNVYFSAADNGAVFQWSPANSNITSIYSGDDFNPVGVAVDGSGNVYIADNYAASVYEWSAATGNLNTLLSDDGGEPYGVAVDSEHNVYFADNEENTVSELPYAFVDPTPKTEGSTAGSDSLPMVLPCTENLLAPFAPKSKDSWLTITGVNAGIVSFSFTGTQTNRTGCIKLLGESIPVMQAGPSSIPLLATSNLLDGPPAGTDSVVLSDSTNWTATANASWLHLAVSNQSGTGSTNVVFSYDANTGVTRAGTLTIAGLTHTVTQAGSTYVADATGATTLAGSGLNEPETVAVDSSGNVYVTDSGDNDIKEWNVANNTVSTLVASGLDYPEGIAVDGSGNVYFADFYNNAIKEWTVVNSNVITLVSNGLFRPSGVALDSANNVYIADTSDSAIKEWMPANSNLITLVSSGLDYPYGLAVDAAGNVYIADTYNQAIKEWTAANGNLVTLVSNGLDYPWGVAVDGSGNVYIADGDNDDIKEWSAASNNVTILASSPTLNSPTGVAVDASRNVYIANYGDNSILELPRAFVDPSPKTESPIGGGDSLPAVLPTTENLLAPFPPASSQSWLTIGGITNGVVSFAFTPNTGNARAANITLLGQSIPIMQPAEIGSGFINAVLSTPNLLGFWPFTTNSQANSVVNSYAGAFEAGSAVGAPGSGPPLDGSTNNTGVALDGSTQWIPTSLAGQLTNDQGSIVAWFHLAALPGPNNTFYIAGESQFGNDFDLEIGNDNLLRFFTDSGSSTAASNVLTFNDVGIWHCVAATFTSGSLRNIYLDGQLVGSSTSGTHNSAGTGVFSMGQSSYFTNRFFQGSLADVAVFSRQLSSIEVSNLFVSALPQSGMLITFDDITIGGEYATITNGYHGLEWDNLLALYTPTYSPQSAGYVYGTISSPNVAFNADGDPAWIYSSNTFTLTSGYFTAAWDDMTLTTIGYNGATVVYTVNNALSTTVPLLINFPNVPVTEVYFQDDISSQFAMDNLTINGASGGTNNPGLAWNTPASIVYGTTLTSAQLDATANTEGTFTYTPSLGAVPNSGSQTFSVTFTPNDTLIYSSATTNVTLVVQPAPLVVMGSNALVLVGQPIPVLTGSMTGAVNDDAISVNFITPYTTNASNYVGNSLTVPDGVPDGAAPLVILGEYSPNGPLAVSPTALPTATVQDVQFYGGNYNFTLYALSFVSAGGNADEQTFEVVASQNFSGSATTGIHTLPVTGFSVNAGDFLAFAGVGPFYPATANDAFESDATYGNSSPPGSSLANPPGGPGTDFTVGIFDDANANYNYITNYFQNQGRTYGFGVDLGPDQTGAYPVVPVLTDPNNRLTNYTVMLTNGTLTVLPMPVTVNITAPSDGASLSTNPFTLSATATAIHGVQSLSLYVNSTLVAASTAVTNISVVLSSLSPGAYALSAMATDSNNNTASDVVYVTVNLPGTTLIDFDPLDTADGGAGGTALSNYLAGDGVSIASVTPGSTLEAISATDFTAISTNGSPMPPSLPNLLTQVGTGQNMSFTLNFGYLGSNGGTTPIQSLTFTQVGVNTNGPAPISYPSWAAHLLDTSGNEEPNSVVEPLITNSTANIPAATFTLVGTNIAGVRFDALSQQGQADFPAVLLDNLLISTNPVVTPPQLSITLASVGGPYTNPANITLNATVNDSYGPNYYVNYYSGPTLIGVAGNAFTWSNVFVGNYTLTAQVVDSSGYAVLSSPITVTVLPGANSTWINFDSLTASSAPANPTNYLAGFGINVITNTSNTSVVVESQSLSNLNGFVIASSQPNMLTQTGLNGPMSFTLGFSNWLAQFTLTRPELTAPNSGFVTHPAWQVLAYDALGNLLGSVQEPALSTSSSATPVPAAIYTLTGPGIASITFNSLGDGKETFPGMLMDDFILMQGTAVAITNPLAGSVFSVSSNITISAGTNSANGVTVTNVAFYYSTNGVTTLAGQAQGPFTILWTPPTNGSFVLTAVAADSTGLMVTSSPVAIAVTLASGFGIVTPPASQTIAAGGSATFNVATTNGISLSYQWYSNGIPVPGAMASSYTISNAPISTNTNSVVVTSGRTQSITSPGAVLTVLGPPTVSAVSYVPSNLVPTNFPVGSNLTMIETASDPGIPLTYQWRLNGTGIPAATNSSYTISNAQPLNSGNYYVIVANPVSFSNSPPFPVAVNIGNSTVLTANTSIDSAVALNPYPLAPTSNAPPGLPVAGNNSASPTNDSLVPRIAGKRAGRFLWFSWTPTNSGVISLTTEGSTFDTLLGVYTTNVGNPISSNQLTSIAENDDFVGGYFTSLVNFNFASNTTYFIAVAGYHGASGNIILGLPSSTSYQPSVGEILPQITQQPSNMLVLPGANVTLSVAATNATSWQWYFANTPVAVGGQSTNLIFTNFPATAAGNYWVQAINAAGSVQSDTVAIELATNGSSYSPSNLFVDKFNDAQELGSVISPDRFRPEDLGGDLGGFTLSQSFSTVGATKEEGEPNHAGQPGGASYWFTYFAPESGTIQFDCAGTGFPAILAIYTSSLYPATFSSLTGVAASYAVSAQNQPVLVVSNVIAGNEYFIAFDGYQGASGAANLNVTYTLITNATLGSGAVTITTNTRINFAITYPPNGLVTTSPSIPVRGTLSAAGFNSVPPVYKVLLNNSNLVANTVIHTAEGASHNGIVLIPLGGGIEEESLEDIIPWNSSSNVPLQLGPNVIIAQGTNVTSTNTESATLPAREVVYFIRGTSRLILQVIDSGGATGRIVGLPNNVLLNVGGEYSVTAVPGPNSILSDWTCNYSAGGVSNPPNVFTSLSTKPALYFTMFTNLVLQANFVPNPFPAVAGIYSGLFAPVGGPTEVSSGFLVVTLPAAGFGAYTGLIRVNNAPESFTGTFGLDGTSDVMVSRPGKSPLMVDLLLNLAGGPAQLTGTISGTDGGVNWTSQLQSYRTLFNTHTSAARYTLILPPGPNAPTTEPGGYGYLAISQSAAGIINLVGQTGDGAAGSQQVYVATNGYIPLSAPLYSGQGLLQGWLTLTNDPGTPTVVGSNLFWIKLSSPSGIYKSGFTNTGITALGSLYTSAHAGFLATLANLTLTISNGNLTTPLVYSNLVISGNTFANSHSDTNYLSGSIAPATGVVTLYFRPAHTTKTFTATGAVLEQNTLQTNGAGWFLGTNQTGEFIFQQ